MISRTVAEVKAMLATMPDDMLVNAFTLLKDPSEDAGDPQGCCGPDGIVHSAEGEPAPDGQVSPND